MELLAIVYACILLVMTVLPFIQHPHWVFRVPEFIKLQLLPLQVIALVLNFVFLYETDWFVPLQIATFLCFIYHGYLLIRYTKFWRKTEHDATARASKPVKVIACNVYQFNTEFDRFIDLIRQEQPDIFVTMESHSDWEVNLRKLENDYPNYEKVTLENTYGMHFYTRLKLRKCQTHYFVADDIPSIEAELETEDGQRFVFFAVHPPPPSPTEEDTSKERDGELLSVAKRVRELTLPVVVTGDFNNVAWAKSSFLFRKTSELIDARIGRGIVSTFHAKYWFFRVPLDLLFHSADVFVNDLKRYAYIGSDHFPVGFEFYIDRQNDQQEEQVESITKDELEQVDELIQEGIEEESDNRETVATP